MFYELTVSNIRDYLRHIDVVNDFVDVSTMKIKDISGTINSVYLVESIGFKPFIIKQALPYFKQWFDAQFSQHRIKNEYKAWDIYYQVAEQYLPRIYYYDEDMCLFIMEYIENTLCFNELLNQEVILDNFADDITTFLSNVFFTTAFSPEKNELISFFKENDAPCKRTVDVIFQNWEREIVRLHDENSPFAATRKTTRQRAILKLQDKFQNQNQALIHGDLKGGAILVDSHAIKLIDYEFAFFAPIGYDLGSLLYVLIAAYLTYSLYDGHQAYKAWLLETIELIFTQFEAKFFSNAFEKNCTFDMKTTLQESVGFAGVQMLMAKIPFFRLDSISREEFNVKMELYLKKTLEIADVFIARHEAINSIEDVIKILLHFR
jgi:5-methylthioribose kinase